MDRKLISVALIAAALMLVSMVSVGLSYSSVYQTENNTCTITCTYGYGETEVTKVGLSGSGLIFTSKSPSNQLDIKYTDTQDRGKVYLYFTLSNIPAVLIGSVWNVDILTVTNAVTTLGEVSGPYQSGSTVIKADESGKGTATIYGFYFDLDGSKSKHLVISSNIVGSTTNETDLQLTIRAIREA